MTPVALGTGSARVALERAGISSLEFGIIALVVLAGTDAFKLFLGDGAAARLALNGVLAAMLGLSLVWARHVLRTVAAAPELAALATLAAASVAWSVDPRLSLRELVPLAATTGLMLAAASMVSLRQMHRLLGMLASCVAFLSLLAVALLPAARGLPPWDDAWRGIFGHKNGLGSACAFGLVLAGTAAVSTRGSLRVVLAAGAAANLLLLLATQSRTAQLLAFVALLVLASVMLSRRRLTSSVTVLLACALGAASGYAALRTGALDPLFDAAGREPTLSGRIPLWQVTWPFVTDRPWLGWGYKAFWEPTSYRVLSIAANHTIGYIPFYSHNGMIETHLNVGLGGLLLVALMVGRMLMAVVRLLGAAKQVLATTAFMVFLLCFLILNMTENVILEPQLLWMAFVAVAGKLALSARALARAGAAPAARPVATRQASRA